MEKKQISAIVKGLALESLTCKAIRNYFAGWVELYGKDEAKQIEKAAKKYVKGLASGTAAAAASGRSFLSDGQKVGAAAWSALMRDKDYKAGGRFAQLIYDRAGRDLAKVLQLYSPYIDKDGNPCVRHILRTGGEPAASWYSVRNLETPAGYLAALKTAITGAKRAALNRVKFSPVIVSPAADENTAIDSGLLYELRK